MLANNSTYIIKNFITGFMEFLVERKKQEFIHGRTEHREKPVNKLRFVIKKSPDSDSDSDSDSNSDYDSDSDSTKRREHKKKKHKKKKHKKSIKSYDSDSGSDLSYKIYKLKNKQRYIKQKKNKHHMNNDCDYSYHSSHPSCRPSIVDCSSCHHSSHHSSHHSNHHSYCSSSESDSDFSSSHPCIVDSSYCHSSHIDCSHNNPIYCNQDYCDFLEFRRLYMSENIDTNKSINVRTPLELVIPVKSEEQNKLDVIQGQLDNLMSNDIDSLTSIMTIDYFDKILDILNSIKQNINTNDETIRNRLIMILHMIFSFITTNNNNVNLKKNITEITQKYNHLVDKIYPNNNFIQPLSREIKLNLKIDPVYDLYVKRYGLPKGTLFDNSKIMLLKAEMQGI